MSREEIEQELFDLEMKDHFTHEDFKRKAELKNMLRELEDEHQ